MANAIHKTVDGDTLRSLASQYFAIELPGGEVDDVREKKVVRAIRAATPSAVTDLSGFADTANLGADKVIYIPTIRSLNRNLFVDNASLDTSMRQKGFDHARKLLRRPLAKVISYLTGFTSAEITRGYVLTQFLNLDGMDVYTAKYLYDTAGITSLSSLASQSKATMDSILTTLAQSPHNRPVQLTQQRHSDRWPREAKLYTRKRVSELTIARNMRNGVPVAPSAFAKVAQHYEHLVDSTKVRPGDRSVAENLGKLYRHAEALMRGNIALRAGQWTRAIRAYQLARSHLHRLAEATGAVAGTVDDKVGINLNTVLDTVKRVLEGMPTEDRNVLGAAEIATVVGKRNRTFGLRAFRYSELETSGTDRRSELRTALGSASIHQLPQRQRDAIHRSCLQKTQGQLSAADANLVIGLNAGASSYLARDLPEPEQATLHRNIGSTALSKTYSGGTNLDVFETACAELPMADVSPLTGALWSGLTADDVLSTTAKAAYPTAFLTSVTPFAKFIALPNVSSASQPYYIAVDTNFVASVRDGWMRDRLKSSTGTDSRAVDESWLNPASLAINAAWSYARDIPLGLRESYAAVGNETGARAYGNSLVNYYLEDGTIVRDVSGSDPSSLIHDIDLQSCTTLWGTSGAIPLSTRDDILGYAEYYAAYADQKYREEKADEARGWYEDVACAIAQVDPDVVDEVRIALTGTFQAVKDGLYSTSTMSIAYTDGTGTHKVLGDSTVVYQAPGSPITLAEVDSVIDQYYGWLLPPAGVVGTEVHAVDIDADAAMAGKTGSSSKFGTVVAADLSFETSENYRWYLYCISRITAIDMGMNWLGYPEYYVPPWSADHLYAVARDLCNRALEAEALVLRLTEAWEQAQTDEFLAAQNAELAEAQVRVAEVQAQQASYSAKLAVAQADLAAQNQELAQKQNVIGGITSGLGGAAGGTGLGMQIGAAAALGTAVAPGIGTLIGGLIGAAAGIAGAVGSATQHASYKSATETAKDALAIATNMADVTVVLGNAQVDVANLAAAQAIEYLEFLQDQLLDASAYEKLLALAWDVQDVYQHHATRVSWLAERALAHETRRSFDIIKVDYGSDDELYNMTRAQRLTSDLESLRGAYTSGESSRRQQLKWVVPLSVLNPSALDQLRKTGECSFGLTQQAMDLLFPGLFLHSLQELHVTIVGLVPPEGVRGVLQLSALSWVRVPDTAEFTSAAAELQEDWITPHLASSPTPPAGSDAAFTGYDAYKMKQIIANGAELSLSAFDVTGDSAVLRAPQGMLSALQHHGLDTSLRLSLPRTANAFEWRNISDVELTLWFLAAYDDTLARAQKEALWRMGERNELERAASVRFPVDQPTQWAHFLAGPATAERVDLRMLVFDVPAPAPFETARLLTNICIALQRASGSTALPLRLCCDSDPVGVALTIGTPGAPLLAEEGVAYTAKGVSPAPTPGPDSTLDTWVSDTFYSGGNPIKDPQQRFVIKLQPAAAGSSWWLEDADGVVATTTSGPLRGTNNGATPGTATYDSGGSWLNMVVKVKIAHRGGTVRIRARGGTGYGFEVGPSQIKLLRNTSNLATASRSYPPGEFLAAELKVWNQADGTAKVEGWIDGLKVLEATDPSPLAAGTVRLAVADTAAGPVPVEFDDLQVYRLTGLGAEADLLLDEPFTTSLPSTWTFVNGAAAWEISTMKHHRLDLANLVGMGLKIDYRFKVVQ